MRSRFLVTFIIISLLMLCPSNSQFTVGVTTPSLDAGIVEPGTTKILSFFIITSSEDDILVDLFSDNPDASFFDSGKYSSFFPELSEQPSSDWVEFLQNPVLLRPTDEELETAGGFVRGWREVRFVLKVPKDAESGYHLIKIRPEPRIPSTPNQGSINIRTMTPVNLIFKVPGDAERNLKVLDVTAGSMVGNRLQLSVHISNEGTVTSSCKADKIKIYNSTGDLILETSSGFDVLSPSEVKELKIYWDTVNQDPGTYPVSVDLNYFTGRDFKETSFIYTAMPTAEAIIPVSEEKKTSAILIFIILLTIIIVAYLIYRWVN